MVEDDDSDENWFDEAESGAVDPLSPRRRRVVDRRDVLSLESDQNAAIAAARAPLAPGSTYTVR